MIEIIEEIVQLEQRRAHLGYALGNDAAFGGVEKLNRALFEAERHEMLSEKDRYIPLTSQNSGIKPKRKKLVKAGKYVKSQLIEHDDYREPSISDDDISILRVLSEGVGGILSVPDIAGATGLDKFFVRNRLALMGQERLVARVAPNSDVWRVTHFGEACSNPHGKKKRKRKETLKEFKVREYRKFDQSKYGSQGPPEILLRDKAAEKVIQMMLSKARSQGGGRWVFHQKLQDKHLNVLRMAARKRVFAIRRGRDGHEYVWGGPNARMSMRDDGSGKVLLQVQAFTSEAKQGVYKVF